MSHHWAAARGRTAGGHQVDPGGTRLTLRLYKRGLNETFQPGAGGVRSGSWSGRSMRGSGGAVAGQWPRLAVTRLAILARLW